MAKRCYLLLLLLPVGGCANAAWQKEPGRFPHSAIQETVAPWDGPATQVLLAEAPLKHPPKGSPHVVLQVYKPITELSGQRFVLDGSDKRLGGALWAAADGSRQTLPWAAVSFDEMKDGAPVEGTYEVKMSDGSLVRGRFRAERWPREGIGG